MTRADFLKELENLLADIPDEDREEAIKYYNDYFDDAGSEHEGEILYQLGSPQRIANMITAELKNNIPNQDRGVYTEKGYQDTVYEDEKYELINVKDNKDNKSKAEDSMNNKGSSNFSYGSGASSQTNYYNNVAHNSAGNYSNNESDSNTGGKAGGSNTSYSYNNDNLNEGQNNSNEMSRGANITLIILLCIFGMPIFFSGVGIIIAVISTIVALFIAFGLAGFCMVGAGIVLFIAGLIKLGTPLFGLACCGAGLVVFGLGMLFTLLSMVLCKKVMPAVFKGIINLCRMPFKNRSVMA